MQENNIQEYRNKFEREDNPGVKNMFVVVSRNMDEEVRSMITDDFMTACAMQLDMLVGINELDLCKALINPETYESIADNLNKYGRDRICNDEEEVYIFFLCGRKVMR